MTAGFPLHKLDGAVMPMEENVISKKPSCQTFSSSYYFSNAGLAEQKIEEEYVSDPAL